MEPVLVSTQALAVPSQQSQVKDCISWLSWKPNIDAARCCDSGYPSTSAHSSSSTSTSTFSSPRLSSASRLRDCIEILERMEEEGTLNMRKIRHSMFYNACKKHKAVEEAFRFTNLIKRPSLSNFNQLMSVCALAKDLEGAFKVLHLVKRAGMKADCILYTTLISACAKAGNIDSLFQVFHEMVSNGVDPNVRTYGALIDGCARAGQVGKAFGVYGMMRSKKVKPDQVIFNSLITACGHAGALERAFDVMSEMSLEPIPVLPNHVTLGALIKACTKAGQVAKALEVYAMMEQKGIEGSIEVYTEAVHACSKTSDLDSALRIYKDLKKSSIQPDEVFFSSLIDVAGHAGKLDVCFDFLLDLKQFKLDAGPIVYSSLMGSCANTGNWKKALDVYRDMQTSNLSPTIPTMNALLTALCDGRQLTEAKGIVHEMRKTGLGLNDVTYAILFKACEKERDIDFAFDLHKCATSEGVVPTVEMCESIIGLCLQHIWKLTRGPTPTSSIGTVESVSFCGRWTSQAVAGLLRRLKLNFRGHESSGKLRVPASFIETWLRPKPSKLPVLPLISGPQPSSLAKKIAEQQRMLRYAKLSPWSTPPSPHCNGMDSIPPHLSTNSFPPQLSTYAMPPHLSTNSIPPHLTHIPPDTKKDGHVHHSVSNGVHVLDAIKGGELIKMSSAMEGVRSS